MKSYLLNEILKILLLIKVKRNNILSIKIGIVYCFTQSYMSLNTSLNPLLLSIEVSVSSHEKRCTRLAAASDKDYQLLTHGRWFSPGTPDSSTTKTGIAEILLKVALNTKNQP
jgi:hypothetical protein